MLEVILWLVTVDHSALMFKWNSGLKMFLLCIEINLKLQYLTDPLITQGGLTTVCQ